MNEVCGICGCRLHRGGDYATPTVEGRSHATMHHYVAERFYGQSENRHGQQHEPIFTDDPWAMEGQTGVFCYECHEELLHNPVLLPTDLAIFRELVRRFDLAETEKPVHPGKLAGRIKLLHEVLHQGLEAMRAAKPGGAT